MKLFSFLLSIWLLLALANPVQAITDPLSVPNNRFGIHILEYDDLEAAAKLVNTQGGQWGYITLVIRFNDLNHDKWQKIFDQARLLKLIPLVRLATIPENAHWQQPEEKDVDRWVEFLSSLNWVVKNRYIILFNEPNHTKEWGNQLDPTSYTKISKVFIKKLKQSSPDYFILPAGFDTAAPNSASTMKATDYWQKMHDYDSKIFTLFDGWNSHSYPNPGFSSSPYKTGFGSLSSFQSEVSFLTQYGLSTDIPVFITETGWINPQSKILGTTTNDQKLSQFYQTAYQNIWHQSNLVAVTPFVLNYPDAPFNQFSWQIPGSSEFYPHYHQVASMPKTSGQPIQNHQSQIIDHNLPDQLIDNSHYRFFITFKNTGQSIWQPEDFNLQVSSNNPEIKIVTSNLESTEPFSITTIYFSLHTPPNHDSIRLTAQLSQNSQLFGDSLSHSLKIVPPPQLTIKPKLFAKISAKGDYRLLIYDQQNHLLDTYNFKIPLTAPLKLYSLVPDKTYRFVLLRPFYLPRQIITQLPSDQLTLKFKPMLPLDLNQSGHFSIQDIFYFFTHPLQSLKLFLHLK